jgi:predicted acetyltransferase
VEISDNNGNKVPGKIYNLTPQADAMTKRFLVEVRQENATSSVKFISGTVVNVSVVLKKTAQDEKNIILPITALEITQNGNFVFLIENGKAKKTKVEIVKIDGETAEIKIDAAPEALLIIDGNKLVRDGDPVNNQ